MLQRMSKYKFNKNVSLFILELRESICGNLTEIQNICQISFPIVATNRKYIMENIYRYDLRRISQWLLVCYVSGQSMKRLKSSNQISVYSA